MLKSGYQYYWRFKGEKAYRYGFAYFLKGDLFRMGTYNGNYDSGPIINYRDIEYEETR